MRRDAKLAQVKSTDWTVTSQADFGLWNYLKHDNQLNHNLLFAR